MEFNQAQRDEFLREYSEQLPRYRMALDVLNHGLQELLKLLPPGNRARLKVEAGRVKQGPRLWAKVQGRADSDDLERPIDSPGDVFDAVNDIVGTRITCNTTADVYQVAEAILSHCDPATNPNTALRLGGHEPRDYIASPKDSGYRGFHIIVSVDVADGAIKREVRCEIQIRTLLQDAWGELTHEDTYKPGMDVPDLARTLSLRLATVLAVMDELAEDIRHELDRSVEEAVESAEPEPRTPAGSQVPREPGEEHTQGPPLSITGRPIPPPPTDRRTTPWEPDIAVGDVVTGEVVFSGPDYGLVQLRGGYNGIVHHSKVYGAVGFIDVSSYLSEGDTVLVEVESVDHEHRRIELSTSV